MYRSSLISPQVLIVALTGLSAAYAQTLTVLPNHELVLTTTVDTLFPAWGVTGRLSVASDAPRRFRFLGFESAADQEGDLLIVTPGAGTTGSLVYVALNPEIVPYSNPGTYIRTLRFAIVDYPSVVARASVTVRLFGTARPNVKAVVAAATMRQEAYPGDVVTIFGERLSTPPLHGKFGIHGAYPLTLGNTEVKFNGIRAPLLYVSNTQINCIVPQGVAGQRSANVVVSRIASFTFESAPFPLPLKETTPGIFTADGSGTGLGFILNTIAHSQTVVNSEVNPAARGTPITFFATGGGQLKPPYPDGGLVVAIFIPPVLPVSLTIGGQPAQLLYAAASLGEPGKLQVNAWVPQNAGTGEQPIVLKIGDNDNAAQKVTIWVK